MVMKKLGLLAAAVFLQIACFSVPKTKVVGNEQFHEAMKKGELDSLIEVEDVDPDVLIPDVESSPKTCEILQNLPNLVRIKYSLRYDLNDHNDHMLMFLFMRLEYLKGKSTKYEVLKLVFEEGDQLNLLQEDKEIYKNSLGFIEIESPIVV